MAYVEIWVSILIAFVTLFASWKHGKAVQAKSVKEEEEALEVVGYVIEKDIVFGISPTLYHLIKRAQEWNFNPELITVQEVMTDGSRRSVKTDRYLKHREPTLAEAQAAYEKAKSFIGHSGYAMTTGEMNPYGNCSGIWIDCSVHEAFAALKKPIFEGEEVVEPPVIRYGIDISELSFAQRSVFEQYAGVYKTWKEDYTTTSKGVPAEELASYDPITVNTITVEPPSRLMA